MKGGSYSCILSFLIYASLVWHGTYGAFQLCTDGGYSGNGTTKFATVDEPLQTDFCVENCNTVWSDLLMNYQRDSSYSWYGNMSNVDYQPVVVKLIEDTQDRQKTVVSVTIKSVTKDDLDRDFNVKVYCGSISGQTVTFTFGLKKKGAVGITSFGVETSHASHAVLRSTAKFTCTAKGYPPPAHLTIFNDIGDVQVYDSSTTSLTATLKRIQCKDMGAYYCNNETRLTVTASSMKAELAVHSCPVQLCRSEKIRRVPADVGHMVNFTVCLVYYPREDPHPIKLLKDGREPSYWTSRKNYEITFQNDENSQIYHTVSIKISNVQADDYGNITLRMTKKKKRFDYSFSLEPRGPPDCPSEIQSTNQDADFITLSWQPGFNGGAKQSFHVYYSTDNVTWSSVKTLEEVNMVNVSNLTEDTEYAFRVVSSNMYRNMINETVCVKTIISRTAKRPSLHDSEATESSSEVKQTLFFVLLVLIVLIASVTIGVIIICWKRDTLKSRQRCIDSSPSDRKEDKTHNNDIPDEKTEDDKHYIYSTVNEQAIRTDIIFPRTEEVATDDGYIELTAIQHDPMEENPTALDLHPYNNLTNVEHDNKVNVNTDNDGYLTPLDMKSDNNQAKVDKCLADVEVHCYSSQNKEYMNISN